MRFGLRRGYALALAATVALVAWNAWDGGAGASDSAAVVEPEPRRPAPGATPGAGLHAAPGRSVRAGMDEELAKEPLVESDVDPFKVVSFLPPPPKVAAPPPPPPKPTAPPFPYRYFGRMVGVDGKLVTYLTRNDELIPIREQDVLDNAYRIDSIGDTQIVVTYLPLEEKAIVPAQPAAQ
ncbi:MAG TPA: hypothetical protein VEC06_20170 [Paucimonas sp.]|nr:hypothetical protein [Paucimonas sp.]